uniref:GRB10 interacting GYF protein 1a n=1 Tax=Cyprinus carpio TaxID=7962 RepID=A0A8C2G961_CYPCA
MTAETLNFGPEWLRALSSGGSVSSPPASPAMPKYKLAEYRYGREEMLALYVKDNKVPEEMQDKEFAAILQDEPQQPLALLPLTEEEQRNFSMSVNSVAVLRLMGKGGGAIPAGVNRGRGSVRGRGRGGEIGFYQKSSEEGEGGFGRGVREIHRSQSWDDRSERRFEKPLRREGVRLGFEEGVPGGRKEFMRSDSDNWRTLREEQEEEDAGETGASWRLTGSRKDDGGPRSAGWREHSGPGEVRRRKFDFDFRDGGGEGGRRRAGSEGAEDERDGLPEWCTDEEDGEMGTFDSSGAFMSIKKGLNDPIPEEEFEFQGLEDEEEDSAYQEKKNDSGGMKHLQQEAEKMVAALQDTSLEEECFTQTLQEGRNTASALPLSHDSAMKWFYKDPQGEIQGPFSTVEMCEWFQAGYFAMNLLVKRGCDEGFQPLGDVIKMWGRVPFAPGPSPPPLLGNMDQERLKKQQELAAAKALYQQLQQQQLFQLINRCGEQGMMPSLNRSMSVPDTGSLWDMHTSASQPAGGEASLWDLMNSSTQGPILEQLQKLHERREAELRAKREEEERKRRDEKRREEQKRREEEEIYRRKQQQDLLMKLLQQTPRQGSSGSGSSWSGGTIPGLGKQTKPLNLLDIQQEAERMHKQQHRVQQQQRVRRTHTHTHTNSTAGSLDGKVGGGSSPSGGGMGVWDEALKNQSALRSNIGLKNSRSSPSLSGTYQNLDPAGLRESKQKCERVFVFTVPTIVAYLKEVESPYEVLNFICSYLGDTVEAKEFARQFLERRAKQKANHQRQQQQQVALQSMFQAVHSGKGGVVYDQAAKLKKKQSTMLHSDPSILGNLFASCTYSCFQNK